MVFPLFRTRPSRGRAPAPGPTLSLSHGFVPAAGQKYTILQADHVTGTFAGLDEGSAVVLNGLTFHIHYTPRSVFLTFGTED